MAKKSAGAKRRATRPARRRMSGHPFLKMIILLAVLAAVVVLAAVSARLLIPVRHLPEQAAIPPVSPVPAKPAPDGKMRDKPTYEVFPQQPAAPPKPPQKAMPPGVEPPIVAIIVDDIGYDRHIADQFLALDVPLTFSVLPFSPFDNKVMASARGKGIEVMLHLAMEPDEFPAIDPGPGALLTSMTPDELIARLDANLDRLPGIVGVNNHMGSRISASSERMRQIFSILKKRGLFYIDSRTTAESVARSSAQLLQLPFAERDIFIDHLDDPKFIDSQLQKLIQRAQHQGYAVAIAHPHPHTVARLKAFLPRLKTEVNLVPASTLVHSVMMAESERLHAARNKENEVSKIED